MTGVSIALSLVLAYLSGSVPSAYIVCRMYGFDIRNVGDRNVGAFNVFRHAGLAAGIITLVADVGKGALAIAVTKALSGNQWVIFSAGIAAIAGHNWSVFLRFQGGRGVGVIVGVLFVLLPREIAIALVLAILVLLATRNSIWCGMALFVPIPLLCFLFHEPASLLIYSAALPCLSGLAHWLTTRHLPPEAKKEAASFWIARRPSQER